MPEVTVFMPVFAEYSVRVNISQEALDNQEFDDAIDEAYNELPTGVCIHCSGGLYMHQKWSLELGDYTEVKYIADENGETVYGDPEKELGW